MGHYLDDARTLYQEALWALRLEGRFNAVELVLHRDCFYDGTCPLPMVADMVLEDVKECLDDVALITRERHG